MVGQKLSDSLQLVGQANSIISILEKDDLFSEQRQDIVSNALCAAIHLLEEAETNLMALTEITSDQNE